MSGTEPAFFAGLDELTSYGVNATDFAAIAGDPDTAAVLTKFFLLRRVWVYAQIHAPDTSVIFNGGGWLEPNITPRDRLSRTLYGLHFAGDEESTQLAYFTLSLAMYSATQYKILPDFNWNAQLWATRQYAEIEYIDTWTPMGSVNFLGAATPLYADGGGSEFGTWSIGIDDSNADAYWLPGDFV